MAVQFAASSFTTLFQMDSLYYFFLFGFVLAIGEAKVIEIVAQCTTESKATPADIQKFMRREIPTSEEGKCMIACIMKKTDAMTDDGKLSVEGMRKGVAVMAKKNKIKQETVETAYQVIDKCTNQVSGTTGDCETAFKFATCFKERAHEMGLVSPDHGHV